ncbi:MAG TPA: glycogen synthase GlgA [Candidatus Desulfobacillus sp.]|nr:glycogen synthase GlgA [Candidatus Desulfobacillus sp.]
MKVLFVTPELAPWVQSGGLGDVSRCLPAALREAGVDARILVPAYPALLAAFAEAPPAAVLPTAGGRLPDCGLRQARTADGLPLYLVDCAEYYRREGTAYLDPHGRDFADNPLRFGLLGKAAALLGSAASPLDWRPDVIHCNDWPGGLAPAWLHFAAGDKAATVMSIHNLAFQGNFPAETLGELGLPPESFAMDGVEFWGKLSFMKAGLHYADRITTVSPRYAEEIQTEAFGYGFAGLLRWRRKVLTGILNGIDTKVWDPASDPFLPRRYEYAHMSGKEACREALRRRLGLAQASSTPLLAAVCRLTQQKGVDLLLEIGDEIAQLPAQLALLGSGDKGLEAALTELAARHPEQFSVTIGFDEGLAHLIEAGADLFLMPSRFEPCGLNQMYSLRYGTPPLVRETGGLADTVVDCCEAALADGTANGFVFQDATAEALMQAIRRAVTAWHDKALWRRLQRNGMVLDFGWSRAAGAYKDVYAGLSRKERAASSASPVAG